MQAENKHVNLIIASPGHSMMSSYVRCLLETISRFQQDGISVLWSSEFSSHVADAREVTLSGTRMNNLADSRPLQGEFTYDKILWIDSDINWTYEDARKLYDSDKDVVTGAYMLANGEVMAYKKAFGPSYAHEEVLGMEELTQIEACGFGFVCVKSGVFEKLSRPWFQSVEVEIPVHDRLFKFNVMGEDIAWCERVRQAGFDIWFDPTVRLIHHKVMKLTWKGITV